MNRWSYATLALSVAAGVLPAKAADISASVQISRSGFVLNRATDTFDTQVSLRNRSTAPISGPLRLVLESIQPEHVVHFNAYGDNEAGKSYVAVPLTDGVLAPGATATALVKLITAGPQVTQVNFKVEGQLMDAASSARLQVRAVLPNAQGGPGAAVGAGYAVRIDGELRGVTDAAGRLNLTVPVTAEGVSVSLPPNHGGNAVLQGLVAGQSREVQVVIDESKEIYGGGRLRFDQVRQGLLSRSAQRITLRFLDFERPVRLRSINNIVLIDGARQIVDLSSIFSLAADGTLSAGPSASFAAVGKRTDRLELALDGVDAAGVTHRGSVSFHLADVRGRMQLQAPPSRQR